MTAPTGAHDLALASNWLPEADAVTGPSAHARALLAVARGQQLAWVGTRQGEETKPARIRGAWLQPVPSGATQYADYHDGQCLGGLRPLYLDAGAQPQFRHSWWRAYRDVNSRVAAAVSRLTAPGATVWVDDYHLQLVPGQLRIHRPDLKVAFFLHTPFPSIERFVRLPMRDQILDGLLGADVIGFQTPRSAANFLEVAAELGEHRHDGQSVRLPDRHVTTRTLPAAADSTTAAALAEQHEVSGRAARMRSSLGNPRLILLSVGTPAPAEAVTRRLEAFAQLLDEEVLDPADTVLIHVGVGGDVDYPASGPERERIDRQVAWINGERARLGRPVIHYLDRGLDLPELVATFLAADVLIATPLHHGAQPIVEEYLAARHDGTGRVVLSEFTHTAAALPEAILVNPHDQLALKAAIETAARHAHRPDTGMRAMRERVLARPTQVWARALLDALDTAARREQAGKLAGMMS